MKSPFWIRALISSQLSRQREQDIDPKALADSNLKEHAWRR